MTVLGTGCGVATEAGDAEPGGAERPPAAVATTTQLGSVLDQITDCAGTASAIVMGPGDDPHDFAPSSTQVAQMTEAALVVANGLGLEAGMQTALDNAEADGAELLEVAAEVDPLPYAAHDEGHGHAGEPGDAAGALDPHFWMDVGRMAAAAEVIGDRLAEVTHDQGHARCGGQVADELRRVDEQVTDILAGIPEDHRKLVTDHAAYTYFAEAYDFDIAGVVIPGGTTGAEPSSQYLAELNSQIENEGADALVTSMESNNRLVLALSEETGGTIPVVELYEGGLGPEGSGAQTYEDAMLFNANALVEALGAAEG